MGSANIALHPWQTDMWPSSGGVPHLSLRCDTTRVRQDFSSGSDINIPYGLYKPLVLGTPQGIHRKEIHLPPCHRLRPPGARGATCTLRKATNSHCTGIRSPPPNSSRTSLPTISRFITLFMRQQAAGRTYLVSVQESLVAIILTTPVASEVASRLATVALDLTCPSVKHTKYPIFK